MKTAIDRLFRHSLSSALALGLLLSFSRTAFSADIDTNHPRLLKGHPVVSCEKKPTGHRWVKATILINARPDIVWHAVHEERKSDPDLAYSKVVSQEHNRLTLEQKFAFLPVIGTATCLMLNEEVPHERIDYRLLKSDHFKAMEGSWVLTPHSEGHRTILELSTYLDLGYPIPRTLIDGVTSQKLQRRLTNVKLMSEKLQSQIAQTEKIPG